MFISILTPTYNRKDKLHRVFESIKSQTLQKLDNKYIFEWIIVDDGSNDDTRDLINKWIKEVDWNIKYIYQENSGKWKALQNGLKIVKGEFTLICDSDDRFLSETFEEFYKIWNKFNEKEKEKCNEIGVLCKNQNNRVISLFPVSDQFVPTEYMSLKWKLSETWSIIKTKNLKYVFFNVPKELNNLKFIPESFFWNKIALELKQYSYPVNIPLRIYYTEENSNISHNIREKFPESFLFESKYFILNYPFILFKYPKVYLKHFIKFLFYSVKKYKELK